MSAPAATGTVAVGNGRYVLTDLLGKGGNATVFAGTDTVLGRKVAVKVLHPHLAGAPRNVTAFLAEARAYARLSHHNIVSVFDVGGGGATGEAPWIVLEHVDGVTLAEALRARQIGPTLHRSHPLPVEQVTTMACEILSALAHAHDTGVTHRDITPSNVMLTRDGGVRVMDFGLVAAANEDRSGAATVQGTPHYASPEHFTGEAVDARSDLYSVGCLLFTLLTGRTPFTGEDSQSIGRQHLSATAPRVCTFVPDTPDWLDQTVAKVLSKDPADRYQTAAEFLAEFRNHQRQRPATSQHDVTVDEVLAVPKPANHDELTVEFAQLQRTLVMPIVRDGSGRLQPPPDPTTLPDITTAGPADADADPVPAAAGPPATPGPAVPGPAPLGSAAVSGMAAPGTAEPAPGNPTAAPQRTAPVSRTTAPRAAGTTVGKPAVSSPALSSPVTAAVMATTVPGSHRNTPSTVLPTPDSSPATPPTRPTTKPSTQAKRWRTAVIVGVVLFSALAVYMVVGSRDAGGRLGRSWTNVTMPNCVGMVVEECTRLLESNELSVAGQEVVDNATAAPGTILDTLPKPGDQLGKGGSVKLVVSGGAQVATVPAVIGKPLAEAQQLISAAGFKVTNTEMRNSSYPVGTVLNITPGVGSKTPRGTGLAIVVASGITEVPTGVLGKSAGQVEELLKAAGLRVNRQNVTATGYAPGTVVSATHAPGTKLPVGSVVSIGVATGRPSAPEPVDNGDDDDTETNPNPPAPKPTRPRETPTATPSTTPTARPTATADPTATATSTATATATSTPTATPEQ